MMTRLASLLALLTLLTFLAACSDYRQGADAGEVDRDLEERADVTIREFKQRDPSIQQFFDSSVGYAVFPEVSKGGAGIGGAGGNGVVYENGRIVGYTSLSQGTIGLQLGGQVFSEIIFFEHQAALDNFKFGNFELAANASAVAASQGAASTADFSQGVAIFTLPRGGLMFEAAVGGQNFTYEPIYQQTGESHMQ